MPPNTAVAGAGAPSLAEGAAPAGLGEAPPSRPPPRPLPSRAAAEPPPSLPCLPPSLADWDARLAALAADLAAEHGGGAVADLFASAAAPYAEAAGVASHGAVASTPRAFRHAPTSPLWARAAAAALAHLAARASGARPDPWAASRLHARPAALAERHRYDAARGAWTVDLVLVKLEDAPFASGAMRVCFRSKKLSTFGGGHLAGDDGEYGDDDAEHNPRSRSLWRRAPNFIAKRYKKAAPLASYRRDVRMQMDAKRLAEAYDRTGPPKPVDMLAAAVLVVRPRAGDPAPPVPYAIEAYCRGEFVKHSSNAGFILDDDHARWGQGGWGRAPSTPERRRTRRGAARPPLPTPPTLATSPPPRSTPHAFSHFTFEATAGDRLVVDVQGVGDMYTDPQIVSASGEYGEGDLGARGQALFFRAHACSPLCGRLGLRPFRRCAADAAACGASPSSASSSASDTVVRGARGASPPPPLARADAPPRAAELAAALDAAPRPPDAHARLHYEACRLHAEVLALAELHSEAEVSAAEEGGLFHLIQAAAGGWPAALGAIARVSAGLVPSSGLLAALAAAAAASRSLAPDARVAAAAARAAARGGVLTAAAAAAAAAAVDGDAAGEREMLDAALAAAAPASTAPRRHPASTTPPSTTTKMEDEFGALPGGGRRPDELLAARAALRARAGDAAGAADDYGAAAASATAAGLGKAAAGYYEAAAALDE
jgi:hypothetical protein